MGQLVTREAYSDSETDYTFADIPPRTRRRYHSTCEVVLTSSDDDQYISTPHEMQSRTVEPVKLNKSDRPKPIPKSTKTVLPDSPY